MKFAFSSNAFTNFSLLDSIEKISQVGYSGIEIMCDVPHAYPPNMTNEKINEIRNTLKKNNLQISNLNAFTLFALGDTYHPSWIETKEEQREARVIHTANCIEMANGLGAKNISIEPGGPILPSENLSIEAALQLFEQGVKKVLPSAEEKQVKILVEPEPGLLIENSKQFVEFIKKFDSQYLKLNFDIGHFYCVNEDPRALILELQDYIEHFHMADIKDRVHYHLIPGLGAIDFQNVFQAIKEIGYDGYITVELYPYKDNPIEAAKKSFEYLQSLKY
ncbi:MAG TPA: sugar phosphate isomerase/epimerase [Candidatus Nitrosocosmicus sp.]|nr:sugar phosphate isomerase/epimerase [Candidatus Nitrosocosmicus sp.]